MNLFGIRYDNLTRAEALRRCAELLDDRGQKSNVFFLNLDCLEKARRDPEYASALKGASLLLPDGIGLKAATALFGGRMRENCNGTDFSPIFIRECAERGRGIFLLGSKEGVAERAAHMLRQGIPGLSVAGTHHGYFGPAEEEAVIRRINESGADALFVGMGVPIQEKWIIRNRSKLRPRLCFAVGALLDWVSGNQPRAPSYLRRLNLEWCWRLALEPRRMFRRYILDDCSFLVYLAGRRLLGSMGISART